MGELRFDIERNGQVEASEVVELRTAVGGQVGSLETWTLCIEQSLCLVTARDVATRELLGIGFLAGNARHAQLVDMTVHPKAQRRGIGRRLQEERLAFATENDIRYVGLTWDQSVPWLHDFYETNGFRDIDFAMWHENSLAKIVNPNE